MLLEGDKAGRMPVPRWNKWGWWFWPTTAIAVAAGTYWGTRHIEVQLEQAAPQILQSAGIDASQLDFKAHHRTMNVAGTLPDGVSANQLEHILASYKGPEGESIRIAHVVATAGNTVKAVKAPVVTEFTDISVSTYIADNKLKLMGVVPSLSHAQTLMDAAQQNFQEENIENKLLIAELPASIDDADSHIYNYASIISNLQQDVIDAQINLDNDLLSGDINTRTDEAQTQLQAMLTGTEVNVTSAYIAPADISYPATEPLDYSELLQNQIFELEQEIRDHVVFENGSNVLTPSAFTVLDKIATAMLSAPGEIVEVGGHTDSQSSNAYNLTLSDARAKTVVTYLTSQGVDATQLQAVGYGESQPIFSNDTREGRAQNRRVEFRVLPYGSTHQNY